MRGAVWPTHALLVMTIFVLTLTAATSCSSSQTSRNTSGLRCQAGAPVGHPTKSAEGGLPVCANYEPASSVFSYPCVGRGSTSYFYIVIRKSDILYGVPGGSWLEGASNIPTKSITSRLGC